MESCLEGESVRGAVSRRLLKWLEAEEYRERREDLWRTGSGAGVRRLCLQERLGDCSGEESRIEVSTGAGEVACFDMVTKVFQARYTLECAKLDRIVAYKVLSVKIGRISVMIRPNKKARQLKHAPIRGR